MTEVLSPCPTWCTGVVDVIRQAYRLKLRYPHSGVTFITYNSYHLPGDAHNLDVADALSYESLENYEDPLAAFVAIAVRLGIEQGRRLERKEIRRREEFGKEEGQK